MKINKGIWCLLLMLSMGLLSGCGKHQTKNSVDDDYYIDYATERGSGVKVKK